MERKITIQTLDQLEVQEILAGLKIRQEQTQQLMKENNNRPWILNGLNRQRKAQRQMITIIKEQLNLFKNG